jgi:hypothetical protein
MNLSDIVLLLLFLAVFGVVPFVVIAIVSRRRPTIDASLQECPDCGAHNPKSKAHCYCCGSGFSLPPPDAAEAALIRRVKEADDRKTKRSVGTQAVEDSRSGT